MIRSTFASRFARMTLRLMGWKATAAPRTLHKAVAVLAPHTSTWDIIMGMLILMATGDRVTWVGKHTLFRGPFAPFLRAMGGIPLNRETARDTVALMAGEFAVKDHLIMMISPEGTRDFRPCWRSGFYHIARTAGVPLVLYYLDFATKTGGCGPLIALSGDAEEDLKKMNAFYGGITPRHPEKFAPICFRDGA